MLLALIHRAVSGKGQVVEANMVDGVSYLDTVPRLRTKYPVWSGEKGTNLLDGGCPYYQCYECKDQGKYISVGALEPQFFANLLRGLGFTLDQVVPMGLTREDKSSWPHMREVLMERFKQRTRDEWEAVFDNLDACVAPVLTHKEMEGTGYQHRPIVHLSRSPAKPVNLVWTAETMPAGKGGEDTLKDWMGWEKGLDYELSSGIEATKKSKL